MRWWRGGIRQGALDWQASVCVCVCVVCVCVMCVVCEAVQCACGPAALG